MHWGRGRPTQREPLPALSEPPGPGVGWRVSPDTSRLLFAPLGQECRMAGAGGLAGGSLGALAPDSPSCSAAHRAPARRGVPTVGLWSLFWRPRGTLRPHNSPLRTVVWRMNQPLTLALIEAYQVIETSEDPRSNIRPLGLSTHLRVRRALTEGPGLGGGGGHRMEGGLCLTGTELDSQ